MKYVFGYFVDKNLILKKLGKLYHKVKFIAKYVTRTI